MAEHDNYKNLILIYWLLFLTCYFSEYYMILSFIPDIDDNGND